MHQHLQHLYCTHTPLLMVIPRSSDRLESLGEAVGVSRQDDTPTSVLHSKSTKEASMIPCRETRTCTQFEIINETKLTVKV